MFSRVVHQMTLQNGHHPKNREDDCSSSAKLCLPTEVFLADVAIRKQHPYVAEFYAKRLSRSVGVVEDALKRYRPSHLAIAFNGGKDCTVLLDLVIKTLRNRAHIDSSTKNGHVEALSIVYFRVRPQFPALEKFIEEKVGELSQV